MTTLTAPTGAAAPPARSAGSSSRLQRLWRGRESDARWVRPTVLALLVGTALLYLVGLSASGYANSFYAAAVEAGAHSWKAMFYGSFDSSNFITVDKPPAALWVMDISARIFGVNSWSILAPQALEGVASVALLYATVRRRFSATAGLIAGAVLALTPVAVLMFRFDNPDSLLVLLLVASAYCLVRALENASTRWLVGVGVALGFGFLTKMLQAELVVPGYVLVYLLAAPTGWWRRVRQLIVAGVAMVVAMGWWIAIVSLVPAADRPYIGGSQHNSILELVFGYNGFGRLTGNETGSVVGGGGTGTAGQWGSTGITRLFGSEMGGQISWLLPAALILAVAGLVLWARRPRQDGQRAQLLIWGTWLVVTGLTFSYAEGIIHPYYTVALAPAIAALVGIGVTSLWQVRHHVAARATLAGTLAVTAVWAYVLLGRSSSWQPWLRPTVLVVGLVAAVALLAVGSPLLRRAGTDSDSPATASPTRRLAILVATVAMVIGVAAPAAYAVQTASSAHSGAIPTAGPTTSGGMGGPGGMRGHSTGGGRGGVGRQGGTHGAGGSGSVGRGFGGFGGGTGTGATSTRPGSPPSGSTGSAQGAHSGSRGFGGGTASRGGGGASGLLQSSTPSAALTAALDSDASHYRWVAATVGSDNAAGLQLATDKAVMAIGGFNGTDPAPSLAQFEAYVAAGDIHYFVAGGTGASTTTTASAITAWVKAHFTARTIGGETVYDLSSGTS